MGRKPYAYVKGFSLLVRGPRNPLSVTYSFLRWDNKIHKDGEFVHPYFSNSLMIHKENTKEINV